MRALTLRPHWAHAVAHLGKRIENRTQPIPLALLGCRIAIHAGGALPKGWLIGLSERDPGPSPEMDESAIVTRAIVATAVLYECIPSSMWPQSMARPQWADPHAAYWWQLDDVITLPEPIHVQRGQLGLWRLPEEVAARLR